MKIDLRAGDPVGQSGPEAHLQGSLEAPEEDPRVFCQSGAHLVLRVAQSACRSHVEISTNLAECATDLFTELLWKRRPVEREVRVRARNSVNRTECTLPRFSARGFRLLRLDAAVEMAETDIENRGVPESAPLPSSACRQSRQPLGSRIRYPISKGGNRSHAQLSHHHREA